jgi:ATP-dependent Clp protease protease subunit
MGKVAPRPRRKTVASRPRISGIDGHLSNLMNIHDYWIDIKNRAMWIRGADFTVMAPEDAGEEPGVEYMMATKVIANLHYFLNDSTKDRVLIHMLTPGGNVDDGMAIYDAIQSMPYPVTIISYTHARSMSSVILQAADRRVMMPSSYFMVHDGTMALHGETRTVHSNAEFYKKHYDKIIEDIYIDKLVESEMYKGKGAEAAAYLRSLMDKKGDVFFNAKQAIRHNFADEIFSRWSAY